MGHKVAENTFVSVVFQSDLRGQKGDEIVDKGVATCQEEKESQKRWFGGIFGWFLG